MYNEFSQKVCDICGSASDDLLPYRGKVRNPITNAYKILRIEICRSCANELHQNEKGSVELNV